MSEDKRIAALAEALASADNLSRQQSGLTPIKPQAWLRMAERALAALPPDWCGHAERMTLDIAHLVGENAAARDEANAEIARLRAALDGLVGCNHIGLDAEFDRLRRIEKEALYLIANTEVGAWPVSDRLRAALSTADQPAPPECDATHD
jgi:hypothetical protein